MIDWILVLCGLVPLVFLPTITFNAFALPQTVCLGLLSAVGIILGTVNGLIPIAVPSLIIFIFLFYISFSFLWTEPSHNGRKELGLQIPLLVIFLLSSIYFDFNLIDKFIFVISITSILISIYAIVQTYEVDPFFKNKVKKGGKVTNPIGTIGNPNFLASFLCGTIWLNVYAALSIHWLFITGILINIYALYKTKCRGGQLAFTGSLIFFILILSWHNKFFINNIEIFISTIALILFSIGVGAYLLYKNWDTFWNKPIDGEGPYIWYASLRYRFCYWKIAWELIKQSPIFGYGLWSYRKEVYRGQSLLNDKDPNFLKEDRYLTPQPRECHNDFIEHIVEFGFLGFSIFLTFLGSIYYFGFSFLSANINSSNFYLMSILLVAFTSILIDAFFFFALRIPSTALIFWLISGMIVALSCKEIIIWNSNIFLVLLFGVISLIFFWHCIAKRTLASYFFMKQNKVPQEEKMQCLTKAIQYAPDDSIYRTWASIAALDYEPAIAEIHINKVISHFDGMVPLWAALFNNAFIRLKNNNKFDLIELFLKNSHWSLPTFGPTKKLLSDPNGVCIRAKIKNAGRANMKRVDDAVLWQIKAMYSDIQKLELQKINLELGAQNVILQAKKQLNIPDDWIYNADEGTFLKPDETN